MAVLDVGCGPGRLVIPIAQQVGQLGGVVAMDIQAGMLSVTDTIFDPHYQRLRTVLRLTGAAGFHQKTTFGNRVAFTANLEKP